MEVLFDVCCGLDVHSQSVVACVMRGTLSARPEKLTRTFTTTLRGLRELRQWLLELGCREVAMESTGVYWRPVWNVLEGPEFHLWLANARAIKHVKGRKTDVSDAEWIAKLLRSGLIVASFVPPQPIRDLRELTRYRRSLVEEAAAERNRIQKILESTNIKLAEQLSDLFGVSGRLMLTQLIQTDGTPDAEAIAKLARGRLREKIPALIEALDGEMREHQRELLRWGMDHLRYLEQMIERVEKRIDDLLEPYKDQVAILESHPGVQHITAAVIIAETGGDMRVFALPQQLSSWTGLAPGNNESAGKKRPARVRPGNRHLRAAMCEVAWAISHTRNTYLGATYWRLAGRIGKKKALLAIARKTIVDIHIMLSEKVLYNELGADYRRRVDAERQERRLVARVRALGYQVTRPEEAAAAV